MLLYQLLELSDVVVCTLAAVVIANCITGAVLDALAVRVVCCVIDYITTVTGDEGVYQQFCYPSSPLIIIS